MSVQIHAAWMHQGDLLCNMFICDHSKAYCSKVIWKGKFSVFKYNYTHQTSLLKALEEHLQTKPQNIAV